MKPVISQSFVLRDCFAADPHTRVVKAAAQEKKYVAEEKTVDFFKGESRRMVEHDYPITPDYVKSFVEATDYKSGVECVLPERKNLGDIREAQQAASRDTMEFAAIVRDLQAKLDDLKSRVSQPSAVSPAVEAPVEEKGDNK